MSIKDTQDTRTHILSIARRMFALRGYEAVGIQEICTASEVTKPTLYYHFGNKRGLLEAVCSDAAALFLQAIDGDRGYSGDLVSDIRSLIAAIGSFSSSERDRFGLVVQILYPPPGSTLGEAAEEDRYAIVSAVERFFEEAAAGHGNIRGKEHYLAVIFLGHAIAVTSLLTPMGDSESSGTAPDTDTIVMAAQIFLYGIF